MAAVVDVSTEEETVVAESVETASGPVTVAECGQLDLAAVVEGPAAGAVVLGEIPVKMVVEPVEPNSQFRSVATVGVASQQGCSTRAEVEDDVTEPHQHVLGSVRPKMIQSCDDVISPVATAGVLSQHSACLERAQPWASDDVTDLPQEDDGCLAPSTADSDVMVEADVEPHLDFMQALIGNMARDLEIQEESMTEWGIHEDMFEDCPGFL